LFTQAGVSPYDEVQWELRTASITDSQGNIIFEQKDVEVPKDWSVTATNIVASKYLHGKIGSPERETGVRMLISRVVETIRDWGMAQGDFRSSDDAAIFHDELVHLLVELDYARFEAAAAAGCRRLVLTSTISAVGLPSNGQPANEDTDYPDDWLGLTYPDSKHEGERVALQAAERHGIEVVVVNPAYVLGVPVDRSQPGETSTRVVGNFLIGRLPAVVDGATNVVDVEDVAAGHLLAQERGQAGERYILGGYNLTWVELIDRLAVASGVRRPLAVRARSVEQSRNPDDVLKDVDPVSDALASADYRRKMLPVLVRRALDQLESA